MPQTRSLRLPLILIASLASFLLPSPHPSPSAQSSSGTTYVLLLAINSYKKPFSPLKYTIRDAQAFKQILLDFGRVPEDKITLLTNSSVNKDSLGKYFEALQDKVRPEDTVLVYFSGHGKATNDGKSYLLLPKTRLSDLPKTAISHTWLRHELKRLTEVGVKRTLLFLDACESGVGKGGKGFDPDSLRGEGRVILASSRQDQRSFEHKSLRHSLFTYALLEGLKGHADANGDGQVTLFELVPYLAKAVPSLARSLYSQPQQPVLSGTFTHDLPLSFPPPALLALRVTSAPSGATLRIDGLYQGKTPWHGPVKRGIRDIQLEKPGFLPRTERFEVASSSPSSLDLDLTPERPAAAITEPPAERPATTTNEPPVERTLKTRFLVLQEELKKQNQDLLKKTGRRLRPYRTTREVDVSRAEEIKRFLKKNKCFGFAWLSKEKFFVHVHCSESEPIENVRKKFAEPRDFPETPSPRPLSESASTPAVAVSPSSVAGMETSEEKNLSLLEKAVQENNDFFRKKEASINFLSRYTWRDAFEIDPSKNLKKAQKEAKCYVSKPWKSNTKIFIRAFCKTTATLDLLKAASSPSPQPLSEPAPTPAVAAVSPSPATPKAGTRQTFEAKGVTFAIRYIPAGSFQMGSSQGDSEADSDEKPPHHVTLTRPFWMLQTEATQGQFKALLGYNPSYVAQNGQCDAPRCPVESVSWHEAAAFANALSAEQSLPSCFTCTGSGKDVTCQAASHDDYPACKGWRLPTEAEWEYAARAKTTTPRYGELDKVAWHSGNSGYKTHPVGGKQANAWGLHDMLGNVREWVYDVEEDYTASSKKDPVGSSKAGVRVSRGGCWNDDAGNSRAADRIRVAPTGRRYYLGFRLLRSDVR